MVQTGAGLCCCLVRWARILQARLQYRASDRVGSNQRPQAPHSVAVMVSICWTRYRRRIPSGSMRSSVLGSLAMMGAYQV